MLAYQGLELGEVGDFHHPDATGLMW